MLVRHCKDVRPTISYKELQQRDVATFRSPVHGSPAVTAHMRIEDTARVRLQQRSSNGSGVAKQRSTVHLMEVVDASKKSNRRAEVAAAVACGMVPKCRKVKH